MEEAQKKIFKIYNAKCPHCHVHVHADYEVKSTARKITFPCPGCNKDIVVESSRNDDL